MRIALYLLALAGTLAPAQWRAVKPEDDPALFRSEVNLVRVDAEVLAGSRAILGLKKADFRVFDNGVQREILNLSHENAPLDLLLIFDVSGSMRPVVERVAESAQHALSQLRDGDRVGIMIFTTTSRIVQPFTDNIDKAVEAIDARVLSQPFNGGTHLHDAIADGASEFLREKPGDRRRAIVVITDNKGQRTRSDDSVIRMLWEADATATGLIVDSPAQMMGGGPPYGGGRPRRGGGSQGGGGGQSGPISVPTFPFPGSGKRPGWQLPPSAGGPGGPVLTNLMLAGMDKVAEQSGGDMIATDNPGPAFASLVERLRSRYSLYYSMPEGTAGERRQVRVELAGNAATKYATADIKARKGYVIPDGSQARPTQVSQAPR